MSMKRDCLKTRERNLIDTLLGDKYEGYLLSDKTGECTTKSDLLPKSYPYVHFIRIRRYIEARRFIRKGDFNLEGMKKLE